MKLKRGRVISSNCGQSGNQKVTSIVTRYHMED